MAGRAPLPSEAGTTLLEMILAMTILAIAIAAISGGMMTSVVTSDYHRQQSDAEAVLISAAEAIRTKPWSTSCPASYGLDGSDGITLPTGWDLSVVNVSSTAYSDGGVNFLPFTAASCATAKLHRVDIRVVAPDSRATEDLSVVKSMGVVP